MTKINTAKKWAEICSHCDSGVTLYGKYISVARVLSKDNAIASLLKKKHDIAIANKVNMMICIGLDFMKNV